MKTLLFIFITTNCLFYLKALEFELTNPYRWSYLNFTWPSFDEYTEYLNNGNYIPENNILSGIKIYDGTVYISLPRYRNGTPVTLTSIPPNSPERNPLLQPYPSWDFNVKSDCSTLQSVQAMEIDTKGIMWVIDGVRLNYISNQCPPKLVLLDLNDNGRVIHSYDFPDDVSSRNGGYLNDIVLDEHPDGDFAYITESSANPGLIVYSRKENKAWKLFDNSTMLYEVRAENFTVNGDVISHNFPIDGIALSQISDPKRYVYYCALTGFALYRIPISVLKNYDFYENNEYREYIEYVGDKQSQGDGMTIDNGGNLFYSLIPKHGIGRWNTRLNLDGSEIIEHNEELFDWPDSLAFDGTGSLYGTTVKHVYDVIDTSVQLHFDPDRIEYNVIKIFTGTKSYLYN